MDPEIQRTIQDIQQEIRELTLVMRSLSNVLSATAEAEIAAFGEKTKEAGNTAAKTTKILDQFGKELSSSTEAMEEQTAAIEDQTKQTKKITAEETRAAREAFVYRRQERSAFRDLAQEMSTTRGAFGRLEESFLSASSGNAAVESSKMILVAALKGAGAALMSLGRSLYAGEQGAVVMARSLHQLADTVGTAAQGIGLALTLIPGIGLAARAAGLAIAGLGTSAKLASAANLAIAEQSDRLYVMYQELAQVGVSASDGMIGLARSAQELGYGLDQAGVQAFTQLMRTAAADLALMSGSVQQGRQTFQQFNRIVRDDVGEALQNLGMTPAAINESVAAFVRNQARLGRAATMSNRELTQGSIRYIQQLDILTKLTGQDAKSIQDRMDADAREERFRAALLKIERTEGKSAADTLRLNMAALGSRFPELAAGLKDMAGGFVDTDAAAKVLRMGIQQIPDDMMRQLGGGFQAIGSAARITADQFGESLGVVGAFNNVFGNLAELVEAGQLSQHDYNRMLQEAINTQQAQAAGAEGVVGAQTQMRRSQMDIRDSLQDLVKTGVAPATRAMETLASITNRAVQGLQGTAGMAAPPGARMGLGGTDVFQFGGGISGNQRNYQNLDPEFRQRLTAMAMEYQSLTGRQLPFGSGQRTEEENAAVGGAATSLHMQGRAADLSADSVNELVRMGLLQKYGFRQNPTSAWHISDTGYAQGGIASGPDSGYAATLHGTEAVVPLPDGKTIPVSIRLDDLKALGPTFAGFNQYRGYNMGATSTDMGTLAAIAERLGAFDQATNTITDPKTWQTVLQSGIATNYEVGGLKIGSAMLPEIRNMLAEEVSDLTAGGNTVEQAIALVREEFGRVMQDFLAQQQAQGNMAPLLQELIALQRNQNSTSEKILQVSQN